MKYKLCISKQSLGDPSLAGGSIHCNYTDVERQVSTVKGVRPSPGRKRIYKFWNWSKTVKKNLHLFNNIPTSSSSTPIFSMHISPLRTDLSQIQFASPSCQDHHVVIPTIVSYRPQLLQGSPEAVNVILGIFYTAVTDPYMYVSVACILSFCFCVYFCFVLCFFFFFFFLVFLCLLNLSISSEYFLKNFCFISDHLAFYVLSGILKELGPFFFHFFQSYCDFGTIRIVIFFWSSFWNFMP